MPLVGNVFVLIAVQLTKSVVDWSTQPNACLLEAIISKLPLPVAEIVKTTVSAGR